jgi:pyruvate/2-oxoglutarate dehydrogenase complex dihydrolipoamide acyltransferase (E2) component
MSTILVTLAAALVGVETGWRPLPTGGMEYIIQVKPGTREALRPDEAIESDVEVPNVKHIRFVVGNGPLSREPPVPAAADGSTAPAAAHAAPATAVEKSPAPTAEAQPHRAATVPTAKPFVPSLPPSKGASSWLPPKPLPAEPAGKPLAAQSAAYLETSADSGHAASSSPAAQESAAAEPQKPWLALWLATLLACGSLAGNVYLGWVAWGMHGRCRAMLRAAAPAAPASSAA